MKFTTHTPAQRSAALRYIEELPSGKVYDINVTLHRERRTLDQNRLYWLWLAAISAECGHTSEELHAYFKAQYLTHRTALVFDEPTPMEVSTRALSKEEFTAYIERIQAFAGSELGLRLPNPEDLYFEQFLELYKHYI